MFSFNLLDVWWDGKFQVFGFIQHWAINDWKPWVDASFVRMASFGAHQCSKIFIHQNIIIFEEKAGIQPQLAQRFLYFSQRAIP